MTKESDSSLDPSIDLYVKAALGKKAINVIALDVRGIVSFTDVFIICSGRSNRQVAALAEHIHVALKKHGIRPISIEGMKEGHWVLMDYGHVVIHIFYEPVREFYDLEGLWSDAKKISMDKVNKKCASEKQA